MDTLFSTLDQIDTTLRYLSETGLSGFDCSQKSLEKIANWAKKGAGVDDTLEEIRVNLGDCRRCRLHNGRKNIVFGAGDPGARLVFVGEGPGYEEDQKGEPFVGAAGQLLTRIIAAINLSRSQVYICNVVKCRPPENRNPAADEIAACLPFLERQIASLAPDFICTLGATATRALLAAEEPISKLRGRFYDFRGIKVLPTYHPAYLLRNPDRKRDVWEDMKMLMNAMG